MKLSGHSYNNNVFQNLLNDIESDVLYTKIAQTKTTEHNTSNLGLSSTTQTDFSNIQKEELQVIAGELEFAANRSKVNITKENLISFAKEAKNNNLRGKSLERAAQKFCNNIERNTTEPIGDIRNTASSSLLDNANNSAVIPAGYNTQYGQNETTTAGYMGMSKNPNTIWDNDALISKAQIPTGDEQIKASKDIKEKSFNNQKQQYWDNIQQQMSDPNVIQEKINSVANVSTKEHIGNQNLPSNSMSIFSDKRDFENIPTQTKGETIAESTNKRVNKKKSQEWNKLKSAKKNDNTVSSVFSQSDDTTNQKGNSHRASIDHLFNGLTGK